MARKVKFTGKKLKQALDDLKILRGLPPYDNWSNICAHDGYFARSLVSKYGMSIAELEKATDLNKRLKKWAKAKAQADKLLEIA